MNNQRTKIKNNHKIKLKRIQRTGMRNMKIKIKTLFHKKRNK